MVEIDHSSNREQVSLVNNFSRDPKDLLGSSGKDMNIKALKDSAAPTVDLVDSKTAPAKTSDKEASCPENPDYLKFIDKAARNMYDPGSLGDLNELKAQNRCKIKTTDDAISNTDLALMKSEDHYNYVLPKQETKAENQAIEGAFSGIGVQLAAPDTGKGPIEIESVFENGPSAGKDLKKGDIITHVDGESLDTIPFNKAVEKIKGPIGTDVKLTVLRDGQPHDVEIKRNKVEIQNIEDRWLDGNIAYIKLKDFMQQDTVQDVEKAIKKYAGASAFVFDIRNNGGGLFNKGVELPSLFLKSGPLLAARDRVDSDPANPEYADIKYTLTNKDISITSQDNEGIHKEALKRFKDIVDVPFAVMVNGNTASSAEIAAAAFKADHEGTLIGSRTFGKGISQTLFGGMPGESTLKVTTGRFFTPKDHTWIGDGQRSRIGITPDIVVYNPPGTALGSENDNQLHAAIKFLKGKVEEKKHTPS